MHTSTYMLVHTRSDHFHTHFSPTDSHTHNTHTHTHTCGGGDSGNLNPDRDMDLANSDPVLSVEEELRFAIRFEEGYDLFDPRYEAWLKSNHPEAEAIDKSTTAPSAPNTPLKLQVSDPPSKASLANTPQTSNSSPMSVTSTNRSPFADLLNIPRVPSTPKTSKTGRARVLTSNECLRILKEKDEKKRQVAEEKEKRKLERELKRKEREHEQKRKAEDRARKAEQRAQEKTRKADEKARKAAERDLSKAKKAEKKVANKRDATSTLRQSRKKIRCDLDEPIDTNLCCICFGSYDEDIDTGREWLQCSCGRWIHEDCIDEVDIDNSSGKVCPLC